MRNRITSLPEWHLRLIIAILVNAFLVIYSPSGAQIWAPEGLNMPGGWDSWSNPPANPVFASTTQVPGGEITRISTGTARYQTSFHVATDGGDVVPGTYSWLFTSGPSGNPFANKWAGVTVSVNTLQSYSYNTGTDNQLTLPDGKWYTMNWQDSGYAPTQAVFMETSSEPVGITAVSLPAYAGAGSPVAVTITLTAGPCPEEYFYLRYSTDGWSTSSTISLDVSGTQATADIPGQTDGTVLSCYALSSVQPALTSDVDMFTLRMNNNGGANYVIAVGEHTINWANLQWPANGTAEPGQLFNVYGQVWIDGLTGGQNPASGLEAWVGYSTENTDPSTWADWIPASYSGASGNNDEFVANLGAALTQRDTFYYATRFRLNDQEYIYGGYSAATGGFWDGTSNHSGVLIVGNTINCSNYDGMLYPYPSFPVDNSSVTLFFDASAGNAALAQYEGDVYAHTGVITTLSSSLNDWRYVKTEWGQNTPETRLTRLDSIHYSLTISNPEQYYAVPSGETIEYLAFVFRSDTAGSGGSYIEQREADGSDSYVKIYEPGLNVKFKHPVSDQYIIDQDASLPVCIEATQNSAIRLYVNEDLISEESGSSLSYNLIMPQLESGVNWLIAGAWDGSAEVRDSVQIYLRGPVPVAELPSGAKNGVNHLNDSTVMLVLYDPAGLKQYAYVRGDFNNWTLSDASYMNRTPDGKHYWISLPGLQPDTEYAFQFYIDGNLSLADPYSDKVLDPWNDQWIPQANYPNLRQYPYDKTSGVVSTFVTNPPEYQWQVPDFTPEAVGNTQSDLFIYELLLRDFDESGRVDKAAEKLDYLKSLGINAIELMPIAEFDGNNSWGFSPNFFFASDKYYGTPEAYKQFIDAAHQRGIAVILDIVPNHAFGLCPMVQMYFDPNAGGYGQPSGDNPWFNAQSPHPYSVGYDFNHESPYTRQFFKDVFQYWLTEYKVDGFRIDLSKGLTQHYSGDDIGAWNAYDQSRVNILTDYYNHIKWVNPNAYVILEHFADNSEETVLANTGMLLWSGMHNNYKQVAMGWETNSDVSWAFHGNRGWNYPNLIDYQENHDEERMMYEALTNGNSSTGYNLHDTLTAIGHQEQAVVLQFGIPGPKMIWQFEEMGYDYSIYYGGQRPAPKPARWDYLDNPARERLSRIVSGMAALRKSDAFRYGNFSGDLAGLGKRIWITHSSMDVVISVNMGVSGFDMYPGFTKAGTWYDYFTGESIQVSNPGNYFFYYNPGQYRVFTSEPLPRPFYNLQAIVTDAETGDPIEGATVSLGEAGSRISGADGVVSFLALPGSNTLTGRKFEWLTKTDTATITSDTTLQLVLDRGWDPASGWANLQWPGSGQTDTGQEFLVHSRIWIIGETGQSVANPDIEAWIGYSDSDTDPSTWTNWIPATFSSSTGNNDEYQTDLGTAITQSGTWYYASRFRFNEGSYVYGGFNETGGGFWDGSQNVSGILYSGVEPPAQLGWVNLQWPGSGAIETGQNFTVYAQAWIDGITGQPAPAPGLEAWIGYSNVNTDPSTWTNWIVASYNTAVGNNDEFMADPGQEITQPGTWYYASRFRLDNGQFRYGGYSAGGGGFWDGTSYTSGTLTVSSSGTKTLHISALLEGLYAGNGTMRQAYGSGGPQFGTGIADVVTIELHNAADYAITEYTFPDQHLATDGSIDLTVPQSLTGSYYITIRHRNSVETTSSVPVSFSGQLISHLFAQPSDVYGSNLLQMQDGWYVIYGGDVNQDGSIDTGDFSPVDNDQFNFVTGYVASDVNGDGSVDTGDFTIVDNNQFNFVGTVHP